MKIAMIAPFAVHPKGTVISRILPMGYYLAKKGLDVHVIVPQEERLSVKVLVGSGSLALKNVNVPMKPDTIDNLRTSLKITKEVNAQEPDIIHFFKPKGYSGLAAILKRFSDPVGSRTEPGYVLDGDDHEGFGGMNDVMDYPLSWKLLFHMQERYIPAFCDRVTLASRYLVDFYSGFGIGEKDMLHLPNGVNPFIHHPENIENELLEIVAKSTNDTIKTDKNMIKFDKKNNKPENVTIKSDNAAMGSLISEWGGRGDISGNDCHLAENTILLFTRFRDHGVRRVFKIFRSVAKERPDVRFLVVGEGGNNESDVLKRAMDRQFRKGSFTFTGSVPAFAIREALSRANISMVPMDSSNITRAKCSAKLVDLMAMGKAVVADAVGENTNYIVENDSGLLVKNLVDDGTTGKNRMGGKKVEDGKGNIREFTDKLVYLLDNPGEAERLGEGASKRVYSNFSWEVLTEKVRSLYGELL